MKKHYKKYVLFAICLLLAASFLIGDRNISVETLLAFTPKDPIKAALVMLLLYALKSATVFFPLIVLEITVGHLFSTWTALGINFIGMLIILTIPYLIGKAAGIETINKLVQRYPRFGDIIGKQQDNALFSCFFLRIVRGLPVDIVTMHLGATETSFGKNLLGGSTGSSSRHDFGNTHGKQHSRSELSGILPFRCIDGCSCCTVDSAVLRILQKAEKKYRS